jgi:hypothetical protein
VPTYAAQYEPACMTRQMLEHLVASVEAASGICRSRQMLASLIGGQLIWIFEAPDRNTLDQWLVRLQMKNYRWLVRIEYESWEGGIRAI